MREHIVRWGPSGARFGIRTEPAGAPAEPCIVLVNSGIVHRVGANRMTVEMARRLAAEGYASLRFDLSGLGDAPNRADGLGWESASPLEIAEAMDGMEAASYVLYGNCGGAAKSFWTARRAPRVTGLLLTNPPPHPADPEFGALVEAAADAPAAGAVTRAGAVAEEMAELFERGVRALFVYAQGDPGERYFHARLEPLLAPHLDSGRLSVVSVAHSNHTFAPAEARRQVLAHAAAWLSATFPRP